MGELVREYLLTGQFDHLCRAWGYWEVKRAEGLFKSLRI